MSAAAPSAELIAKYDVNVPRYTSYPTAVQFHDGINGETYGDWLKDLPPDADISVYVHIPFCAAMCWFCACNTKVVARNEPVARYTDILHREIDLVAAAIGHAPRMSHMHWGGGSPTMLRVQQFVSLFSHFRDVFSFTEDAEIAVELDPRITDSAYAAALAKLGVTRASFGIQDFDDQVQAAINRFQSYERTAEVINQFRSEGINDINLDLIYGLPRQSVKSLTDTVKRSAGLRPDRIAIFGYAHVPWMKTHQRLIDEATLPDGAERLAQFEAARHVLEEEGYVSIGLDHFALPDDPLAVAHRNETLHRNFQGYTIDQAQHLIGFGASAIGSLPQGYLQNASDVPTWTRAIEAGQLPIARGVAYAGDDVVREYLIEQLLCYHKVDLAEVARKFELAAGYFDRELGLLQELEADGVISVKDQLVSVTEVGKRLIRAVCAVFDSYWKPAAEKHSRAI